jgi:DNA-directed RNA polymerase specialized sigma24 family protein
MKAAVSEPSVDTNAAAFATTHWSVVLAAQAHTPAADQALEKLCRTYWPPIYSFLRRDGRTVEDAQDLTQAFFAQLLERRDFDAVRREKGRLRSYLLVSLKHFLVNERERAMSLKRGAGRAPIPLDELMVAGRNEIEPAETLTADRLYERRWALTVLDRVLERLHGEYCANGKGALADGFGQILTDETSAPTHAQIARELGMSENAVKQAFHRFRRRYRELLREEIAHTVAVPGDIEDELRHLIAVLRE